MDEIIAVYNSIRSQSLAAKEQRFRLYNWKVLSVLVLLGFSISENCLIVDDTVKTSLIALAIPIIVMLFDLNITGRSNAIERDGILLRGLEDKFADKHKFDPKIMPEEFYVSRRQNYWTASNRLYENLSQTLVSLFAIVSGWYIDYEARNGLNIPVLVFILPFVGYYIIGTGKLIKEKRNQKKD